MVSVKKSKTLFLGLTHIGQIYSTSWLRKVGPCAVHDFDNINLDNFKKNIFTKEEPLLKKFKLTKKFEYLNSNKDITKYDVIFFTYDTPINKINGTPNLLIIKRYLKNLLSLKLKKNCTIFITSQVYPGFTEEIIKKFKVNKKINIIYMVDTLKMGQASNNFLYPEQLIFGGDKKNKNIINKIFKKFKCKKYLFNIKEAELIKISINLYLFFSVSFANIMDNFSKNNGIKFSKTLNALKNDKRIGKFSYIQPSLGMAGGHLERDFFYFNKLNKNRLSSQILTKMFAYNQLRKNVLEHEIKKFKIKKLKILIVGISYKKQSYSITNGFFSKLLKNKKINTKIFDDQYKDLSFDNDKFIKNINDAKSFNLFIYNYSSLRHAKKLQNLLDKNKNKYLINISFDNKEFFKGKNIKNLFFKELKDIN
jgi:nucleotide sugar dehydrogenase